VLEKQGSSHSGIAGVHVNGCSVLCSGQEDFGEAAILKPARPGRIPDAAVLEFEQFMTASIREVPTQLPREFGRSLWSGHVNSQKSRDGLEEMASGPRCLRVQATSWRNVERQWARKGTAEGRGRSLRVLCFARPQSTPVLLQAHNIGGSKPAKFAIPRLGCVFGPILFGDGPRLKESLVPVSIFAQMFHICVFKKKDLKNIDAYRVYRGSTEGCIDTVRVSILVHPTH
jgi:hypothetical protein